MINSIGMQNPGVDAVIEEELPKLAKCLHKKVMANIGGDSEEEYVLTAEKLDKCPQVGWLELNLSCPNVAAEAWPWEQMKGQRLQWWPL